MLNNSDSHYCTHNKLIKLQVLISVHLFEIIAPKNNIFMFLFHVVIVFKTSVHKKTSDTGH